MTDRHDNLAPPVEFTMPNWDARWPPEALRDKYFSIGPRAFDRGYRQRPQTATDLVFPNFLHRVTFFHGEDWRAISDPASARFDPSHPAYVDPRWPRYTGMDLSGSARRGTVIATIAMAPSGRRHLIDLQLGKWTAPEKVARLDAVARAHTPEVIFVENNALQELLVEMIQASDLPIAGLVEGFNTGRNKSHPEYGLPHLDLLYAQEMWRVSIAHGEHDAVERIANIHGCACGPCVFVRDTRTFTYDDKTTPDTIMAVWMAKEASRMGGRWSAGSVAVGRDQTGAAVRAHARPRERVYRIPTGVPHQFTRRRPRRTDDFGRPIMDED